RAIQARSKSVWENGLKQGKLNSSSLARLASTGDCRIFRKRVESKTKDVAVSLVVDMSGSMCGSKIHTAAAASYALSNVLDRLKIPHEVICFTTHTDSATYHKRLKQ
ncbi:cobalamin biosynthesis protein CobT, partial [Acinetobacter baumannii]